MQNESIFSSGLRSMVKACFAIFGLFIGIIPVMIAFGSVSGQKGRELPSFTWNRVMASHTGERRGLDPNSDLILRIDIHGMIGGDDINTARVEQILQESQERPLGPGRIKGILLNLNTGGGTVVDSDGIYRALKRYKARYNVPVYAYIDGICASGGIYIASAADKVYASSSSLVGSVGVALPPFFNFTGAMEKIGIASQTITAGSNKDMMNPTRPWNKDEAKNLQQITDSLYEQFLNIVAEARPQLDRDRLINEYGARVFPAGIGQEMGYIDAVENNPDKALEELMEAANAANNYQVIQMEMRTWIHALFGAKSPLLSGKIQHEIQWMPGVDASMQNQFLYLYTPGME